MMKRLTYVDLLVTQACFYWLSQIVSDIQQQNAKAIEQAERTLQDNERLMASQERMMAIVDAMQEELDHLTWLNGQDWEGFPIQ